MYRQLTNQLIRQIPRQIPRRTVVSHNSPPQSKITYNDTANAMAIIGAGVGFICGTFYDISNFRSSIYKDKPDNLDIFASICFPTIIGWCSGYLYPIAIPFGLASYYVKKRL